MRNAFLLFTLILITTGCCNQHPITVSNTLPFDRTEVVSIDWESIVQKLQLPPSATVIVTDDQGNEIVTQKSLLNNTSSLLLLVKVAGNSSTKLLVKEGIPTIADTFTVARLVPERKDDFSWENDRMAYRMYGPALEATGEVSNGIDIWLKRTPKMVTKKWYANEEAKLTSYHNDNGEGLDCYKVGRTLGAGAMAPYIDDTLWLGRNFITHQIIEQGPLRTSFSLTYAPYTAGENNVIESRTITIDAGSQFCRVQEVYDGAIAPFKVAAGIVKRDGTDQVTINKECGYIAYSEPADPNNGTTHIAAVFETPLEDAKVDNNHLLAIATYQPSTTLTYYTGAGWSKWGFETPTSWEQHVAQFAQRLKQPLQVKF